MTEIKMNLIHAFGSTCFKKYKNALSICDQNKNEAKIIFPAGKVLAKKCIERQEMEFVDFSENSETIELICILPTRAHAAIAFKPLDSALQMIKIYSFKNGEEPISIKIFHETEKIGHIKLMVFSESEPKFMCVLLGEPHNKLIYIDTYKNKPLAESSFSLKEIEKMSVCPYNSHLICLSGGNLIKLFKIEQYAFKPLDEIRKLPKGRRISDHVWYKKKTILVSTDKCQVFILEENKTGIFQIKHQYANVFNQINIDHILVTSICAFSHGFILGSNNGKFSLWVKKEDINLEGSEVFQLARKWSTTNERASEVTNIEVSVKEDLIAISLANNDIATLYLNQLLPQVSDLLNNVDEKEIVFEYLYKGFHNEMITGMDICQQRPLIATCSKEDSTIRIWNYKNFGCKLLRMFYFKVKEEFQSEKPLITLAFHPSGYYLAVGCIDKLRLFHVLNNELRPYREIGVKHAHIVKFSNGGHLLAACFPFREESTIDHIKIYNALTLEEIFVLKQHASIIKSIEFKHYDESLLTISEEGTLIQYKTNDWTKLRHISKKNMIYETCIYCHSRNSIIAFGRTSGRMYLEEYNCENNSSSEIEVDMNVVKMAEVTVGKEKGLVLSLANGNVVIFGGLQRPVIMDHQSHHLSAASQIVISPCGKYLITAGTDCLILIYKIYAEIEGVIQNQEHTSITVDDFLADVVLINKSEISKVNQKQKQFTKVINSLTKKLKIFSEEGQKKQKQRMLELELQKNRIIEDINYRMERLKNQIDSLKAKNNTALQSLDQANLSKAEVLEQSFEEKINFQIEKHFQLEQEMIQLNLLHKNQLNEIKKNQEQQIEKLKQQFSNKFKFNQQIYTENKNQSENALNIFEQRIKQIEEEQEDQIREVQSKKQKFKSQTAIILEELHEKQQKLKKQHAKLTDQRNEEKQKNEEKLLTKKKIEKQVEETVEKLRDMTFQFDEKSEVLRVKQKRIIQFEQKIMDLQKKKHILSYKGTQMKKAIEPKEVQIEKLKIDLLKLKKQFEISLDRKQKTVLLMEKNQKEKLNLDRTFQQEKRQTEQETQLLDQIIGEIYNCIEKNKENPDGKVYFKELVKIYHKFVEKNEKVQNSTEVKGAQEMTKQIIHLEKSLFQLNNSNEKNIIRKNDEIYKRIKQNSQLVNNLNEIKKENRQLILKIKSKKEQIDKLKNQKNALMEECKNVDAVTYKMFIRKENDSEADKSIHREQNSRNTLNFHSSQHKLNILAPYSILKEKEAPIDPKKNLMKVQCEIVSETQFTTQKIHKLQYLIKDMKQKIRKHLTIYKCSAEIFLQDEDLSEIQYS